MSTLNPRQRFEIVEELQLLVETENLNPTGYKNYVANPDGALGGWGWSATGGTLTTAPWIVWTANAVADSHIESNGMPVTPGEWVSAQFDILAVTSGRNVKGHFNFYGVSGALLSSSANDVAITAAGHSQMVGVQVPASAVSCRLALGIFNGSGAPSAGNSFAVTGVMLTKNATNTFGSLRANLVANPSFETDIAGWAVEA